MLNAAVAAGGAFIAVFLGLRLVEWLYHRARRTPDWSPHWGSWAFAVLVGLAVFFTEFGRS